jgi:hypothetical protein
MDQHGVRENWLWFMDKIQSGIFVIFLALEDAMQMRHESHDTTSGVRCIDVVSMHTINNECHFLFYILLRVI